MMMNVMIIIIFIFMVWHNCPQRAILCLLGLGSVGTHKYDDGPASSPSHMLQHLDDDGPTSLSPFCNFSDGDDDDAGPSSDLCVPTEPQPN